MTNIGTGTPNAHSKIQPAFPFSSFKIFIVVLQSPAASFSERRG